MITAGRVVHLQAVENHGSRTVELSGLDAWRQAGAKSVTWRPEKTVDCSIELGLPTGQSVELPPSPWADGILAIMDHRGVMVCTRVAAGTNSTAALRRPEAMTATVVDDGGKPIANATVAAQVTGLTGPRMFAGVYWSYIPFTRSLGTTNALGRVSFFVPELIEHVATWGTYRDTLLLLVDGNDLQQAAAATQDLVPLTIKTTRTEPIEVVIRGTHSANATLSGMGSFSASVAKSSTFGPRLARTTRAAGSRWRVHGIGPSIDPFLHLQAKRPTAVLCNRIDAPTSPVVINLDARPKATIKVTRPDVGPAPCVLLVGRPTGGYPPQWEAVLATDLSGHAELLLEHGEYFVYALSGASHGLAIIDATESLTVSIELKELETMRVRVLDKNGKPIAGARARGGSTSMSGSVNGSDLESQWIRLSMLMLWHFVEPCRTDKNGVMEMPVFIKSNCEAEAKVWIAGAESEPFQLQAGSEIDVVIL